MAPSIPQNVSSLDNVLAQRLNEIHFMKHRSFKFKRVILCAIATILGSISCTSTRISDRDLVFVDVPQAIELLDKKRRLLGLAKGNTGVWVDSRRMNDYRAGHIPGAVSVPYEQIRSKYDTLKAYDTILVYGSEYNDPRAMGMSKRLMELGHRNVRTLKGGLRSWIDGGYEVVSEE